MAQRADKVKSLFSSIARRYDLLNRILSFNQDKRWRRLLAKEVLNEVSCSRALDICAGTGELTLELLASREERVQVAALDFSREMLKVASRKIIGAGKAGRVLFVEADALSLPFADNSFDIAMMAFGLRNLSDSKFAFNEMCRVTRQGGRVAILEFSLPKSFPMRQLSILFIRSVIPIVGKLLMRGHAYKHLADTIQQFPGPDVLCPVMENSGISGIKTWRRMFGVVTLYIGLVK